jgi:signal transduction histidine kinase
MSDTNNRVRFQPWKGSGRRRSPGEPPIKRSRPPVRALIAAAIVVVASVIAIVALPVLVTRQIDRLREQTERHTVPARRQLNEIGYRLSMQIASLANEAFRRDARVRIDHRATIAAQEAALRSLAEHARALGPDVSAEFAELESEIRRWHVELEHYLGAGDRATAAQQLARAAHYPDVMEATYRLDAAFAASQARRRADIGRITRRQVYLTAFLVLLGLLALVPVIWMLLWLRRVLAALESAVRTRDEILGIVTHDLRSPLTTIALSTQLMPGSPPEEQADHAETILTTVRRMQRLIADLLDATKIEHSSLSIKKERVDPAAIADEAMTANEPIAAEKQIDLQASIDEPLPAISGDHDRVVQALGNLLGNAFKFTPAGGTVRLAVEAGDGKVRFTVSDSGPGIAPSDLPHLFEPFWQGKKTAHLGAGLGLKITRAIVEAHGGSIHVRNASTGGASFTFELPADPTEDRR